MMKVAIPWRESLIIEKEMNNIRPIIIDGPDLSYREFFF